MNDQSACKSRASWKYDLFELSFLTFVTRLNLSDLVSDSPGKSERLSISHDLSAAKGQLADLVAEETRLIEGFKEEQQQPARVTKRIIEIEKETAELETTILQLELRIKVSSEERAREQTSSREIKSTIRRLRDSASPETYILRSSLADQIQSIVSGLRLFPAGSDAHHIDMQPGRPASHIGKSSKIGRSLDDQIAIKIPHRQNPAFEVTFSDEKFLNVVVDRIDPQSYISIKTSDGETHSELSNMDTYAGGLSTAIKNAFGRPVR